VLTFNLGHQAGQRWQEQEAGHAGSFTRWKPDTIFENTAHKTPQQSSYAELAFTVIASKTRAVMNAAQIPKSERFKLWNEAATTVTALDNLIPVTWKSMQDSKFPSSLSI
jgi:hypothetical protein